MGVAAISAAKKKSATFSDYDALRLKNRIREFLVGELKLNSNWRLSNHYSGYCEVE